MLRKPTWTADKRSILNIRATIGWRCFPKIILYVRRHVPHVAIKHILREPPLVIPRRLTVPGP